MPRKTHLSVRHAVIDERLEADRRHAKAERAARPRKSDKTRHAAALAAFADHVFAASEPCPDCGLESDKPDANNKYGFGNLRYCADCHKEWDAAVPTEPDTRLHISDMKADLEYASREHAEDCREEGDQ